MAAEGLKRSSIYLSTIRRMQVVSGTLVASWPLWKCALKGIKLRQANSLSESRLPVTPDVLKQLRQFWEKNKHNLDHTMS